VISSFAPSVNGEVWALASDGTSLWIGGTFTSVNGTARRGVAKLNPATGAVDTAFNAGLASGKVTELALVNGRLLAGGTFPGKLRALNPSSGANTGVSTGYVPQAGGVGRDLCDAASRFETDVTNPARPTWINYTGGDTLHSVAATDVAVYVQGHQRWLDNPQGRNAAGPGAVSRQGIGAINPATGLALSWNPGKERGVGGKDLYVTSAGLWVGSDTNRIGGETRRRIALMPVP
jgi:hypothetical protein